MPIGIVCGIGTLHELCTGTPHQTWHAARRFHLRGHSFWILQMIYRGVEYRLVQSIAPKGWRWSFEYAGRQRSGHKSHRDEAVTHLKRSIDQAIRRYDAPRLDQQRRPADAMRKILVVPASALSHQPAERSSESPTD